MRSTTIRKAASTLAVGVLTALAVSGVSAQGDRSIFSLLDTGGRRVGIATIAQGSLTSDDMLSAGGRPAGQIR